MANTFVTFRKFNDEESVAELVEQLKSHNIEYVVEDYSSQIDNAFGNSNIGQEFRVKLQKEDFPKAYELLQEIYTPIVNNAAPDYYLFSFSNEELIDLIRKRDEWGIFDFILAQKILADRGRTITAEEMAALKEERIIEKQKKAFNPIHLLNIAYLSLLSGLLINPKALFLCAISSVAALVYTQNQADGNVVYSLSPANRLQSLIILIVSVVIGSLFILMVTDNLRMNVTYIPSMRRYFESR